MAVNNPGRVQATGALEDPLALPQCDRHGRQDGRGDGSRVTDQRMSRRGSYGIERGLAAHAARGTDDGVAVGGVVGQRHSGSESDVEDVVRVRTGFVDAVAVADDAHVVAGGDDTFAEKESVHEVDVVAGGPHRHCQHLTANSHFEWFLDGQRVGSRDDLDHPRFERPVFVR